MPTQTRAMTSAAKEVASPVAPLAKRLLITGFKPVDHADFATTLAWDREAKAAGYDVPG